MSRIVSLASGSAGNVTLLETPMGSVLLDCGLPPQEIQARLVAVGADWKQVRAVVLSHTHGDHWNRYTFEHLRRLNIPLLGHARHHAFLASCSQYEPLRRAKLVQEYVTAHPLDLFGQLQLRPLPVPHDSDPTFAFHVISTAEAWRLGYASDLGQVPEELASWFADVHVLAIEFNHDVALQKASRRPRFLVNRVLGKQGHLSNHQAACAVEQLVRRSPGQLQAVIQLHLSRDCNTPELAQESLHTALAGTGQSLMIVSALQHRPTDSVPLVAPPPRD